MKNKKTLNVNLFPLLLFVSSLLKIQSFHSIISLIFIFFATDVNTHDLSNGIHLCV